MANTRKNHGGQDSNKRGRQNAAAGVDFDAMLEESMSADIGDTSDDTTLEAGSDDSADEVASTSSAGRGGRQASSAGSQTANASGEQKSVGSVIAQSLARESQEQIDNALSEVNKYIKATKDYAVEKPGEATLIAFTAGMAAWVLLGTKPGRMVFDAGVERFVPEVTRWFSSNFSSNVKH